MRIAGVGILRLESCKALAKSALIGAIAWSAATTAANARENRSAFDSASVNVILAGHITAKCSVGGGGTISLGELIGDKQATARFDVGCNVPFELVFRSMSGGIAHSSKPQGEGPYVGLVPYKLDVVVPALTPAPTQLHAEFSSNQMIAGASLKSGDAIAAGGGEIRLQTEMTQGRDLLAGQYVDSIMIVINPRV